MLQAKTRWGSELAHYQSDLQVRLAVHNGQVEGADSRPLTDQCDMLLLDRSALLSWALISPFHLFPACPLSFFLAPIGALCTL